MSRIFSGLRFQDVFSGSSNLTNQACALANSIVVFNDGGSDVTVTINGDSWVIKSGDMPFDECFEPFNKFSITATGAFRAYTRG